MATERPPGRLKGLRDRVARRLLGINRADVAELGDRIAGLSRAGSEQQGAVDSLDRDQKAIAADIRKLAAEMGLVRGRTDKLLAAAAALGIDLRSVAAGVEALEDRTTLLEERAGEQEARIEGLEARQDLSELHARISPTMEWVDQADVPPDTLVSVVMATRGRARFLQRAIRSVVGQTYERWELLVVDDGSGQAAEVVERFADPRIRLLRAERRGVAAARNLGLAEAKGEVIAYLDDDNLMHRGWLKTVVWAFTQQPWTEVLYGARIVEDPHAAGIRREGLIAPVHLERFDRRRLEEENYIDIGVLAHRRTLLEGRFDESLVTQSDWELILRLTRDRPPLVVPAVAVLYGTGAPGRLSKRSGKLADRDRIRDAARGANPLRILSFNSIFPLTSEMYIEATMEAIAAEGMAIAYCRTDPPLVDMAVRRPVYEDLDAAIREFAPDLLLLHWVTFGEQQLSRLESAGLPFAVRAHSFDYGPDAAGRLLQHPLCVGLWAFPSHTADIPGASVLPLFLAPDGVPAPGPRRDLVVSVSAGLPKKDWDLLLEALCALEEVDRRVVVATTNTYEDLPATIAGHLEACSGPHQVQVDVPHDEVLGLLARTAVHVYTLDPGEHFGMPMSVAEALCAGAAVILPDRPEALEFAGPRARGYRTADDIVRHVREVLAAGPEIEAEHRHNRDYGLERFADPAIGKRFAAELGEALDRWRAERGAS
jgi:hypothetical protein